MEKVTLIVEGMSCGHCKMAVEKAVSAISGVSSVIVDLETKQVNVTFDAGQVNIETVKEVIEEEGYTVVE